MKETAYPESLSKPLFEHLWHKLNHMTILKVITGTGNWIADEGPSRLTLGDGWSYRPNHMSCMLKQERHLNKFRVLLGRRKWRMHAG